MEVFVDLVRAGIGGVSGEQGVVVCLGGMLFFERIRFLHHAFFRASSWWEGWRARLFVVQSIEEGVRVET